MTNLRAWIGCFLLGWGVTTFDSNGIWFAVACASMIAGCLLLYKVNADSKKNGRA